MPTVSTIIPAYNAAPFIRETLDTVFAQTGVDNEVIVVDDQSTDDTWEILGSYGDRIRRVQQANGGPAKARNHGARLATGDWLAFVDADDLWHPAKLQSQLALAGPEVAFVYSDRENFGETAAVSQRQSDGVQLHSGKILEPLMMQGNFVTLSSVMIRRDLFERLGGFDESPELIGVEDWDLWLRAAGEGEVRCCPEMLVRYRWHAGGLSRRLDAMHRGQQEVLRRASERLPATRRNRLLSQARASALAISASYAAMDQLWLKAFRWFFQAACLQPLRLSHYKGMVKCVLRRA